jgi:hypothetical protein
MAGFFDKLIGSEAAPEDRDYKTREELSSPEEQQAYQAGEETSNIPGLDYAKSLFRGLGREVSGADMGSQVGQQYQQEMEAHRQRQAEAERLRQAYPEAYRGGQNVGSEDYPVEAMVLGVQPMTSSIMRGIAGGTKYSRPNLQYGEFREVPPDAQVGASRAPAQIGYEPKIEYQPGPEAYWQEGGAQAPRGPLPEVKVKDNSQGWHLYDRPAYGNAPVEAAPSWGNAPIEHSIMDLHQQRLADINSRLNPSLRMPTRSFLGTKDMGTNIERAGSLNPELVNSIAERQGAKGALAQAYATGRMGEVRPIATGPEELTGAFSLPKKPMTTADRINNLAPDLNVEGYSPFQSSTAPRRTSPDRLSYNPKTSSGESAMRLAAELDAAGIPPGAGIPVKPPSAFDVRNLEIFRRSRMPPGRQGVFRPEDFPEETNLPVVYRPKNLTTIDGAVSEAPGSLNFGVKREGYQEPKGDKSGLIKKALGLGAAGAAAGIGPLAYSALTEKSPGALPLWNPNIKSDVGPQTMAGRYGVEPIPVVANTPKDEPAAEPKAAPKATPKAQPKATPKRAAQKRAAPRSAGKAAPQSNQKYWGDWRDAPGFADDPIGNFIDSITGQQKRAAKPGRANVNRPSDLGSLFSDGGMVRKHYEDGGAEDRIPIVSDIGDALGSLFQGGEQPVVAKDRAEEAPADKSQGFGGLGDYFERWSTNPLSQLLFASGAATMGSPSTNPWQATGEGLSRGLEYMQAAQANQERLRDKEEARKQLLAERRALDAFTNAPETVASRPIRTSEKEEVEAPQQRVAQTAPINPNTALPSEAPQAPEGGPAPVEAASKTVAETETAPEVVSPVKPVTQPVVATDDKLSSIDEQIAYYNSRRDQLARLSLQAPHSTQTININDRILNNKISQLQQEKQNILARQQKEEDRALRQKSEERLAKQSDPYTKQREKFLEEQGTGLAKSMKTLLEVDAPKAESLKPTVDAVIKEYETAVKEGRDPNVYGTEMTFNAAKTAYNMGVPGIDRQKLTNTQRLQELKTIDTLQKVGGSLGAQISNSDRDLIEAASIAIGLTPEEELTRLKVLRGALNRQTQIADLMTKYAKEHGGVLDKDWPFYLEERLPRKNMFDEKTYKTFGVDPGSKKAANPFEAEMRKRGHLKEGTE